MFSPLIDAWLEHERGEAAEVQPRMPPPHLTGITWRFACRCGRTWSDGPADARYDRTHWIGPARQCAQCREWVEGLHVSFTPP